MKTLKYFLPLLLFFACESGSPDKSGPDTAQNNEMKTDGRATTDSSPEEEESIGYQLSAPAKTYILPAGLEEISGMQSIGDQLLALIQDEDGTIFIFDKEEGKLVQEIEWGEKGDYEGIAGDTATLYVLESGGAIHRISNISEAGKPLLKKWKTNLEKPCDAEGLYLLKKEGLLLIACKEGLKGVRKIWSFDLQQEALRTTPYLQIPQEALENELVEEGLDRLSLGLKKVMNPKGESGVLAPSGIAQHPFTKDFWILSSQSKLLVVISPGGEVKHIEELKTSLFQQPESITFTDEGDLLIGNEAAGGEPNILQFEYDKENQ